MNSDCKSRLKQETLIVAEQRRHERQERDNRLTERDAMSPVVNGCVAFRLNSSGIQSSCHRRHLPQDCIAFSSPAGRTLFTEAITSSDPNYMQIYFPLAEQFITQGEPAFCGLATLAMCLNALQIDPGRLWKGPWRWFSEELFECCTSLLVAKEKGISMSEFVCLARCNGVMTEEYRATSSLMLEQFRAIVQHSCATSSEIVVLNYSRQVLGQSGDGHFSPIGGYHVERDMVLLMDVARFKYPPHWVKLSQVFEAMQRVDQSVDLPRGLVVMTKGSTCNGPNTCEAACLLRRAAKSGEHVRSSQPCCESLAAVVAARHMADATSVT
uniref:glutathione gamma-glutamylcysteinyltransferase n=1 Tax=Peronospora matthiolae TaxID=2874970 RepID=A0AAV1TQ56_9STRA